MKARRFGVVILGALALALAGCDNFSLKEMLTLPDGVPTLTVGHKVQHTYGLLHRAERERWHSAV